MAQRGRAFKKKKFKHVGLQVQPACLALFYIYIYFKGENNFFLFKKNRQSIICCL